MSAPEVEVKHVTGIFSARLERVEPLSSGIIEGETVRLGCAYTHPTPKASETGKATILKSIGNAKQLGLRVMSTCSLAAGFFVKGDRYGDLFRVGKA